MPGEKEEVVKGEGVRLKYNGNVHFKYIAYSKHMRSYCLSNHKNYWINLKISVEQTEYGFIMQDIT